MIIFIRLVFVTLGPLPNEKEIVEVANTLLYSRLATKLATRTQRLSDPVSFVNITYTSEFFFPRSAFFVVVVVNMSFECYWCTSCRSEVSSYC